MDIKISKISKLHFRTFMGCNTLTKGIVAKIHDIEEKTKKDGEKYGKYLLVEGKSKVYAFAFGETYKLLKKLLKTDRVMKFPANTFSCKPKYVKGNSNSTCKYDMTFLRGSRFIAEAKSTVSNCNTVDYEDISSLRKVSELIRTTQTFSRKLKSVKFNCGEVYRYLGCKVCNFSIPRKHTDDKYYCKGLCNDKKSRRSKIGAVTERKICFTIHNVNLSDIENDSIESVVIFNSISELLLKKCGKDFDTDNEAATAWSDLIANSCFDITLKRNKKKKDSRYPPAVFVHSVDNVIAVTSPMHLHPEPPSDYSCDQIGDNFTGGKKKREVFPKFPKFDMKLQHNTEPFQNYATKYRITSRPPGLVLLINNFNFPYKEKEKDRQRLGSEVDMDLLQRGFREMGFEIYGNKYHMDIQTRGDFTDLLEAFREELCSRPVDSIFIIISSHGRNNEIELTGGQDRICVVEEIMIPFSDEKLSEYQGKPKVIMPLTCQNLGNTALGNSLHFMAHKLFDMVVCCPSLPGFEALRKHRKGTLYVHSLMQNLMKYASSWDFKQILDKVQSDVKKQIQEREGLDISLPHYLASAFGRFVLVPTPDLEDDESNPFQYMEID